MMGSKLGQHQIAKRKVRVCGLLCLLYSQREREKNPVCVCLDLSYSLATVLILFQVNELVGQRQRERKRKNRIILKNILDVDVLEKRRENISATSMTDTYTGMR